MEISVEIMSDEKGYFDREEGMVVWLTNKREKRDRLQDIITYSQNMVVHNIGGLLCRMPLRKGK